MALSDNKIGDHRFVSLDGEPIPPMQIAVLDDRNGVDGSEKILVGTKGTPFSLVSQVDAEDYATGKGYIDQYKALIDGDAVTLVQGGVDHDGRGFRVLVLRVEPLDVRPIKGASGNKINPPSEGWVITRWDLVAVPFGA